MYAAGEPLLARAQEAGEVRTDTNFAEIIAMVGGIAKIQGTAPEQIDHILQIALEKLEPFKNEEFYAEFQSIITALEYLPRRTETDPERIAERTREKEIIKRRLERRC